MYSMIYHIPCILVLVLLLCSCSLKPDLYTTTDLESDLVKSLEKNPDNESAHLALGRIYLGYRELDKALEQLNAVLDQDENSTMAYGLISGVYREAIDLKRALEYSRIAQEIDPASPDAVGNLAMIYIRVGLPDEAEAIVSRTLEPESKNHLIYSSLARIYLRQNRHYDAKQTIDMALRLIQDNDELVDQRSHLLTLLGNSHLADGNVVAAKEPLEKAIMLSPKSPLPYYSLGRLHTKTGNHKEALAAFNKAIETNPAYFRSYINIGNYHLTTNNTEEAIPYYREAIAINDKAIPAYIGLHTAYDREGRSDERDAAFRKIIELNQSIRNLLQVPANNTIEMSDSNKTF